MTGLTILCHHRTRVRDGQSVHIDELVDAIRASGNRVIVIGPRRTSAMATPMEERLLPKAAYALVEFAYSLFEFAKLAVAVISYRPDALYERANLLMLSGVWTAALFRLLHLLEVNSPLAEERVQYGGLAWPRLAAWTERVCWQAASMVKARSGGSAKDCCARPDLGRQCRTRPVYLLKLREPAGLATEPAGS